MCSIFQAQSTKKLFKIDPHHSCFRRSLAAPSCFVVSSQSGPSTGPTQILLGEMAGHSSLLRLWAFGGDGLSHCRGPKNAGKQKHLRTPHNLPCSRNADTRIGDSLILDLQAQNCGSLCGWPCNELHTVLGVQKHTHEHCDPSTLTPKTVNPLTLKPRKR